MQHLIEERGRAVILSERNRSERVRGRHCAVTKPTKATIITSSLVGTSDNRADFPLSWFGLPAHGRADAHRRSVSHFPGDGVGPTKQRRALPRSCKCHSWGCTAASRICC